MEKRHNYVGWDVLNKKAEENYNLGEELYEETLLSKRTELKGKRKNLVDDIVLGCLPELHSIASRFIDGESFGKIKGNNLYNHLKKRNYFGYEDIVNVGAEGLIEGLIENKYKPSEGALSTYIENHLLFFINDYFKDEIFQTIRVKKDALSKGHKFIPCVNFSTLEVKESKDGEYSDKESVLNKKFGSESLQDPFFKRFEDMYSVDFLLNHLSPNQKNIFELAYFEDKTQEEIARIVEKSFSRVDQLRMEGKGKLRRMFGRRKKEFI